MKQFRCFIAISCAGLFLMAGCGDDDSSLRSSDRSLSGEGPDFSYAIAECTPMLMGKALVDFPEDGVIGLDDGIRFGHVLDTFCSAAEEGGMELRAVVDGERIAIDEVFTGEAVRCTCPIPVSGELRALEAGVYTVRFTYAVERDGLLGEPEVLYETRVAVGGGESSLIDGEDGGDAPQAIEDADLILTAVDAGSTVELAGPGSLMAVILEANPSTGYRWGLEAVDESVLEASGEAEFQAESDLVGAGGRQVLRFRALAAGRTELRLVYRRPWETEVEPIGRFAVTVVVR